MAGVGVVPFLRPATARERVGLPHRMGSSTRGFVGGRGVAISFSGRRLSQEPVAATAGRGYDESAMITGVHAILFTGDPDGVRAFFIDVLGLPSVDAGSGWPIFALPPAELAAHPAENGHHHELYLMCDDIETTVAELQGKGVEFTDDITNAGWGLITRLKLPDGTALAVYEPKHPSPFSPAA